jgi:hypothetical protein
MNCPFCDSEMVVAGTSCPVCSRNPRSPRRPCPKGCGWTPSNEVKCCRCGTGFKSDLRWKIPLIVGIFLLALILSVAIQILSQ